MGNSLPCVNPGSRIARRRVLTMTSVFLLVAASVGLLGGATQRVAFGSAPQLMEPRSGAVPGAHEEPSAAEASLRTDPRLKDLVMPGAGFRARDPIVVGAAAALGYLMGTQNYEDPSYLRLRRTVSDAVAARMELDPVALHRAWSRVARDHQIAVLAALTQLDVKYVEGKETPYVSMDCSGLLWYAWRVAGVDAPRVSVAQIDPRMRIPRGEAKAGDIAGEGKHVHLYLGVPKAFVHAPYSGRKVRLKIMKDSQWNRVAWTDPSNIANYRL